MRSGKCINNSTRKDLRELEIVLQSYDKVYTIENIIEIYNIMNNKIGIIKISIIKYI